MSKKDIEFSVHKSVLLKETIDGLNLSENKVVLDATFGGGGHSAYICNNFKNLKIIAIDQDADAWERSKNKFNSNCDISFHNLNFRNLDQALKEDGIKEVDGIIFDLGLSSDQLENSQRGFSFMKDEPLLMTMRNNPDKAEVTAFEIINTWAEESLADIIYGYGEERYARRIAKGIVEARNDKEIKTTGELAEIIKQSVPGIYRKGRIHPATKTFQAIRIAVNDELRALEEGLEKGFQILKKGGRISIISFHSLEDRIVKRFYQRKQKEGLGKIINKKVIIASLKEIKENPRSRSAKLRILEKTI